MGLEAGPDAKKIWLEAWIVQGVAGHFGQPQDTPLQGGVYPAAPRFEVNAEAAVAGKGKQYHATGMCGTLDEVVSAGIEAIHVPWGKVLAPFAGCSALDLPQSGLVVWLRGRDRGRRRDAPAVDRRGVERRRVAYFTPVDRGHAGAPWRRGRWMIPERQRRGDSEYMPCF
jgi:hypothetical protein